MEAEDTRFYKAREAQGLGGREGCGEGGDVPGNCFGEHWKGIVNLLF